MCVYSIRSKSTLFFAHKTFLKRHPSNPFIMRPPSDNLSHFSNARFFIVIIIIIIRKDRKLYSGLPVWINFKAKLKFLLSKNVYVTLEIILNWQPCWRYDAAAAVKRAGKLWLEIWKIYSSFYLRGPKGGEGIVK